MPTVNGMPKITDYVREGFNRRQRPWDRAELPEWWGLVVWVGFAGVTAALLLGAMFGHDGSSDDAAEQSPPYSVQTLTPYIAPPPPARATPAAPTPGAADPAAGAPTGDFTATAAAQVPLTGGGTTVVPVGARNVAVAAAKAEATGDWTGIPLIGNTRPSPAPRTPHGALTGEITVADPAVTGNSQYLFSATISHSGADKPYLVRIAVERGQAGYAVRAL
jgi:hypothetical protein